MGKKRYNIFLTEHQAKKIDRLVETDKFDNASEVVRHILRLSLDDAIDEIEGGAAGVGSVRE